MSAKRKDYFKIKDIRENFLSLSGTVYGYHDNNICYCNDEKYKGKCVPTAYCGDCDLNRSGECPINTSMSIPGVS